MSTALIVIPPEDARIIARLSQILAKRIVLGADVPLQRQALLRGLFALQRLPLLTPGLSLSISAGRCQLQINFEHCGFVSFTEDWHTEFRVQYFPGSSHAIESFATLQGEVRIAAAMLRLDDFEAAMERPNELSIEDHSTPGAVDEPPINDYLDCARTFHEP